MFGFGDLFGPGEELFALGCKVGVELLQVVVEQVRVAGLDILELLLLLLKRG